MSGSDVHENIKQEQAIVDPCWLTMKDSVFLGQSVMVGTTNPIF